MRGELDADRLAEIDVEVDGDAIGLPKLVAAAGLAVSTSEAARKVSQGGVKVDREKVTSPKARIERARGSIVLEVGRRAVRVRLIARP